MSVVQEPEVKWSPEKMIEVVLNEPDDFLKVRETLTRIGVASRKEKKIYQSCHILHKQGRYFLVHFKELFALDGKHANLTVNDVQRRNRIAQLLADWGLIGIVDADKIQDIAPLNQIKVLAYKDKQDWILETKYNIGSKKEESRGNRIDKILIACYKYMWMPSGSTQYKLAFKGEVEMGNIMKFHSADMGALMDRINKYSIGMDNYFERLGTLHETTSNYPPYNLVTVSERRIPTRTCASWI